MLTPEGAFAVGIVVGAFVATIFWLIWMYRGMK